MVNVDAGGACVGPVYEARVLVTLGITEPVRLTAAAAPAVLKPTTVVELSPQLTIAVPEVVLLPQLPLPAGMGS